MGLGPRVVTVGVWRSARLSTPAARIEHLRPHHAITRARCVKGAELSRSSAALVLRATLDHNERRSAAPPCSARPQARCDCWCRTRALARRTRRVALRTLTLEVMSDGRCSTPRRSGSGSAIELLQEPDPTAWAKLTRGERPEVFVGRGRSADNLIAQSRPKMRNLCPRRRRYANMSRLGRGIYESEASTARATSWVMVWRTMFGCASCGLRCGVHMNVSTRRSRRERLRNHACVALWCGNNENAGSTTRDEDPPAPLRPAIYHEPTPGVWPHPASYWPTSPYGGSDDNSERRDRTTGRSGAGISTPPLREPCGRPHPSSSTTPRTCAACSVRPQC